jgi:hypothetical protein
MNSYTQHVTLLKLLYVRTCVCVRTYGIMEGGGVGDQTERNRYGYNYNYSYSPMSENIRAA